jgi:hypothetical protein
MAIGSASIFVFLMTTATLQSTAAHDWYIIGRTPDEYVQLPSAEFHERVGKAMLELAAMLESNEHVKGTCLDKPLRFALRNDTMYDHHQVYKNLLDFSNLNKKCSKEQIDTYMSLKGHLSGDKVPELMRHFLEQDLYGSNRKIADCAKKENERLPIDKFELDCVNEVFKEAFDLEESTSTEKLLSAVTRFTISESEFSARAMLAKAKECTDDERSVEKEPLDILAKFMGFLREKIYDNDPSMVSVHNILGLARIYGHGLFFKPKLRLMNEYHRICTAWSRDESRKQFENNLIKQMGKLIDRIPRGRKHASNYYHTLKQVKEGLEASPQVVNEFIRRIKANRNYRKSGKAWAKANQLLLSVPH